MDPQAIATYLTTNQDDAANLQHLLERDDMDHETRVSLEDDMRTALLPILAKYRKSDEMSPEQFAAHLAAMTALIVRKELTDAHQ